MEKRNLGNLGIDVSLLGFGCMRFPTTKEGKIDEAEAEKMLDYAISKGVNYIDTAYPYHNGESEPFVGKVLKKYPRDSFYLATKLPVWAVNTLEDVDRIFEEQLQRLQTDHIDFYLMHAMNAQRHEKYQAMGAYDIAQALKAEGVLRHVGMSFHDSPAVLEQILIQRPELEFVQLQFNYADYDDPKVCSREC